MVKCLSRYSTEYSLLLEFNEGGWRRDPWNPVPHVLSTVHRGDTVFICMGRLTEYDEPPFITAANYIDLIRQVLEVSPIITTSLSQQMTPGYRG